VSFDLDDRHAVAQWLERFALARHLARHGADRFRWLVADSLRWVADRVDD